MTSSIDTYRSVDVSTAPRRALVQRALDAAIIALADAESALAAGRPHDEPLRKAQTIVGGLMTALDFRAGDLAQRLLRLYLFAMDRIHKTSMDRVDRGLSDARRVLMSLRDAWSAMPADETPEPPSTARLRMRG